MKRSDKRSAARLAASQALQGCDGAALRNALADTAVGIDTLFDGVGFEAGDLVEARGVRSKRPDGRGRLGEEAFLTIVIVSRGRHRGGG